MQNKIEFSSTFTTNGYYVNRKVAANLKNNGVNCITITIDGPSHIHNKRRCLKSGEGTFDAILKNVLDISDIVKVLISCTVDKENAEYIRELLDILEKKGLAKKVLLALSQTIAFPGTCESTKELCFNTSEFCELLKELYPVIFKRGFNLSKSMPQAYLPNCSAIGMRTIIFDAEGYMYKCTKTLGKKNERIGHVSQVMKQNNSLNNNLNDNLNNNVKWLAWDPFEDKRCLSCRVLPLCMGGCPYISIQREVPEIYGSKCRMWKYMIDDFVKILYNFRKEEKNESIKV